MMYLNPPQIREWLGLADDEPLPPDDALQAEHGIIRTTPVRWGEGGPVVGEAVQVGVDRIEVEVTDPDAAEALTDDAATYSIGGGNVTFLSPFNGPGDFPRLTEKIAEATKALTRFRIEPGSEASRALREIGKMFAADDETPTDPRERALWLRKHRNTGPAPKGHKRPK